MKSDRQIQKEVLEQLAFDPAVQAQKIGVSVESGVVTLSGAVPSYAEKYLAEDRAFQVSGVKAVVEGIVVELPENHRRSDLDIAKAISATIDWQVRIPSTVKASISDGIVTLQGEVEWKYQRDAAMDAARHVRGVTGINNFISLSPKASSFEIKASIERAHGVL